MPTMPNEEEWPEDFALDALSEAMPFLRQLRDCAQFDAFAHVMRINGKVVDFKALTKLIRRCEVDLYHIKPT